MGIRRFTRNLESYAHRVTFPAFDTTSEPRFAVIDGPALAFHVLAICIAQRGSRQSPLDSLPGYRELADATIEWLDRLTVHGFSIGSICFDGFLPWSKKDERVHRFQSSVDNLRNFRAKYDDARLGQLAISETILFDPETVLSTGTQLQLVAPLNFVAVILHALQQSHFRHVTTVVPGEADIYCARVAQAQPSYVFTGDSDLLVHDIGPEGSVIFYKDLQFSNDEHGIHMHCLRFSPTLLAEQLGLPNLLHMAYYAWQDPYRTIPTAAALAKTTQPSGPRYDEFASQYLRLDECRLLKDLEGRGCIQAIEALRTMDTRILETLLQLRVSPDNNLRATAGKTIYVFLSSVIEDTSKASAILPGQHLRSLVYSILKLMDPSIAAISEYKRRGTSVAATEIFPQTTHLRSDLEGLTLWLQDAIARYSMLNSSAQWRAMSAALLAGYKARAGKINNNPSLFSALILNDTKPRLSWMLIHTRAEMQGILHQLHFLRQVVLLAIHLSETLQFSREMRSALESLTKALQPMPAICELYDWVDVTRAMNEESQGRARALIDRLCAPMADEDERNMMQTSKQTSKKNKVRKAKTSKLQPVMTLASANLFDALQDDNDE